MKNYLAVIEIDSEVVKIIQAEGDSKGFIINKILAHTIVGSSPQEAASYITQLISQNGIKADKLIGVISRRDLTVRTLKLPSTNKEELQQMVSFEAVKQIPFPAEEIFFDYRVMEINQEGYSEVILSIAHRNVVNKALEILNKSGLKPDILTLTTEGLYLWAKTTLSQELETKEALLIMNIDRNKVEIEIISGQKILLSRTSSFGASSLSVSNSEHQKYRDRLLLEVKRSIKIYNKEQKQSLPIEKLIITGSMEAAESISDTFRDRLGIDTSVVESTEAFPVDDRTALKEPLPEGTSISSAIGAIFALDMQSLNMLPPELKEKQRLLRKGRKAVTLIVLGVCVFAMISLAATVKFYQKKILLNNIKSSIKKISPVTEKLESKFEKLQMIQAHINATKRPLTFLYELHRVIPKNVLLNYLSFSKKGRITLQGGHPCYAGCV